MPLNVQESDFFDLLTQRQKDTPSKSLSQKSIAEFRSSVEFFKEFSGKPSDVPFQNTSISARDGFQIPVRIYNHHLSHKTPVLIFYVGNGYVVDLFEINCIAASRVAKFSGYRIVIANTRLAPEFPLPKSIEDAYDVTQFIAQNFELFNVEKKGIIVGGICSGAHCAAVITNLARADNSFNIHHQVLLNGYYDLTNSCLDFIEHEKKDMMLSRSVLSYLSQHYGLSHNELNEPMYSPYLEKNLASLPKTTFIIAEYDGTRGDSESYYKKLLKSDTLVEKIILPGQTHNTFLLREALSGGVDPARVIADVIKTNWSIV